MNKYFFMFLMIDTWISLIIGCFIGISMNNLYVLNFTDKKYISEPISHDYIFICKNRPEIGQLDWGRWLEKYGDCEKAVDNYRER